MASGALKGLTIQIDGDTSGLNAALKDVDKKSRDLSSELSQINKLLKLDPSNTEALAQKQKVLAEAISNTEAKLNTLHEAEKQAQAQLQNGEITEAQYRALQREILYTEKKLDNLKQAATDTAKQMDNLGKESDDAKKGIKDTGDEAEDAEADVEGLGDGLVDVAKNGFTALAAAATAAVGAIFATAEASREYRAEMGKLDTAFRDADFSSRAAYQTYSDLQGILGETEQAVEAANHLAKLCTTEEELANWTDILTGVYGTFGASLQPEALTEAANETARCGQITGALADAINWAAAEGETFGVTLKKNTKENKEWNDAVKAATSAEDYFNLALQECNTQQERQQLITETLTGLYKGAAVQYKETNKAVIEANKANEEWNATMADIGAEMEPVVTDIKKMGTALLKEAKEPMKDVADFIRTKLLPAVTDMGRWATQNVPRIITLVGSLAGTVALYKTTMLSAELATKGLTIATALQQKAQAALNLITKANPYVLLATAILGVATALTALNLCTTEAIEKVDPLTEAERELMEAADEAAEAFREQSEATDELQKNLAAEHDYTMDLADELFNLADASGKVAEEDQARAKFILGELSEAMGTEWTMVDGVIQKYGELKGSIEGVMRAKLANSLLEAENADYIAAVQGEASAWENLTLKEKDYQAQLAATQKAQEEYEAYYAQYREAMDNAYTQDQIDSANAMLIDLGAKETAWNNEKALLDEKQGYYEQALADYESIVTTKLTFEEAQQAALEGNYEKAVQLLTQEGDAYSAYADTLDAETARALSSLQKGAVDAGIKAELTRENFEKGVDGYTEEMVAEAEQGYDNALGAFSSAYVDAYGVGEDLGSGIEEGLGSKTGSLYSKATSIVSGIISAMRTAADSHSPSRKTIAFGEDMGEGTEIGLENTTKDLRRAATNQAAAILEGYRSQELTGQNTLRQIAEQQASHAMSEQMTMASANAPMLEKILSAIERGQVLLIDGDTLVGATANRMDSALGRRHDLAAKGAI